MNFNLPAPQSTIVDNYRGLSVTVPAMEREPAVEITRVRVSLEVLTEAEDEFLPGDISVQAELYGYPLTAKGERSKSRAFGTVFGYMYEETRWELLRAAVLASCEKHRLDPTKIADYSIATWSETQAAKDAALMERFGVKGKN